jgi:hypothetical protein
MEATDWVMVATNRDTTGASGHSNLDLVTVKLLVYHGCLDHGCLDRLGIYCLVVQDR